MKQKEDGKEAFKVEPRSIMEDMMEDNSLVKSDSRLSSEVPVVSLVRLRTSDENACETLQLDEDFDINKFTGNVRSKTPPVFSAKPAPSSPSLASLPDDDDFLNLFPSIGVADTKKSKEAKPRIASPDSFPIRAMKPSRVNLLIKDEATPSTSNGHIAQRIDSKDNYSNIGHLKRQRYVCDDDIENTSPKRIKFEPRIISSSSKFKSPLAERQINKHLNGTNPFRHRIMLNYDSDNESDSSDERQSDADIELDRHECKHGTDNELVSNGERESDADIELDRHDEREHDNDSELDSDEEPHRTIDEMASMSFPNIEDSINFDVSAIINKPLGGFNKNLPMGEKRELDYEREKMLTTACIKRLYNAIVNMPKDLEQDPKGLRVPLMIHQKQSLKWMKWREGQDPSGGILADDMGLGKTLQMIALVLAVKNERKERERAAGNNSDTDESDDDWGVRVRAHARQVYQGRTLVVCPPSLIDQWEREILCKCRSRYIRVYIYHGTNKRINESRLAKYDIVITSYQLLAREYELHVVPKHNVDSRLYRIRWERVILDEAHFIRNFNGKQNTACFELIARSRWALTGTPIQNKQSDLYALLKFIRCSPFDEPGVWKNWVSKCAAQGNKRLVILTKSLMLRRTKEELIKSGAIKNLPDKKSYLIEVELDPEEMIVYQKLLLYSKAFFMEFLKQRKDKKFFKQNGFYQRSKSIITKEVPNKVTKVFKMLVKHHRQVEPHFILTLILRLRQMCCHPALITSMLDKEDVSLCGVDDSESFNSNVIDHVKKVIDEEQEESDSDEDSSNVCDEHIAKNVLSRTNPVFGGDRESSKVRAVMKIIREVLERGEKIVIVSQWTSFLDVIALFLDKTDGANYGRFTGQVAVRDRQYIVDRLNDPEDELNILLLSLTCGGVGLNLVGANNLLIADLHWNPALETQAQDRIYRFGQDKDVKTYKLVCTNTMEQKVMKLQSTKLKIAKNILDGTVDNRLTIEDLKLLFE